MEITVQATNNVFIVGTLVESTYHSPDEIPDKDKYISGQVSIATPSLDTDEAKENIIPVHFYAKKYKNDGNANPAFDNISKMQSDFISKMTANDVPGTTPSKVRINSGTLTENAFYGNNDQLVSGFRVRNAFFALAKAEEEAMVQFETKIVIANIKDEVDREDNPTGRIVVKGVIVQYGGRAEFVEFIAEDDNVIEAINSNWEQNETVKVSGRIRYYAKTLTEEASSDGDTFGRKVNKSKTFFVKELLIEGGSASPCDDDQAYNIKDIGTALTQRNERLEESKKKSQEKNNKNKANSSGKAKGF
jgi:hypothetical protein